MLVGSRHGPEPYDWSMRPPSRPKAAYSEIGDKARHNVRYGFEPEVPPPARMSLLPPTADIGTPTAQVRVVPIGGIRVGFEKGRQMRRALMHWFKTFYEAVGLPKLNGVAINGDFCEPSRLVLIRAADINSIDNLAVRPIT